VYSYRGSPSLARERRRGIEPWQPLADFLDDFPSVSREQAVAALEQAMQALLADARSS